MIKSSYFANIKNVENPISISGWAPKFYTGPQYKKLAPKRWFFEAWKEGRITNEEYVECFNIEVLSQLDIKTVYNELKMIYNNDNFTIVCYEKPGDFCHRHLVIRWFQDAGFPVEIEH